jgi:hypothetical protein
MVQTLTLKGKQTNSTYDYYLGVSSDTLLVLDKEKVEVVEEIIRGIDNSGLLLEACDEDCFLEAITMIKQLILAGKNPLQIII